MGKLIYALNVSLDGYIETPDHGLDWTVVDDELHSWFNDRARELDASLYGRRLYEVMSAYWPGSDSDPNATPVMREFGVIWRATPRFVFSSSLESAAWGELVRGDDVGVELGANPRAARRRPRGGRRGARGQLHPAWPGRRVPADRRIPWPSGAGRRSSRPSTRPSGCGRSRCIGSNRAPSTSATSPPDGDERR